MLCRFCGSVYTKLILDIICDGPVAQSLGVEPIDPAVSSLPPRKKNTPIITSKLVLRVIISALVVSVGTLFLSSRGDLDEAGLARNRTLVMP